VQVQSKSQTILEDIYSSLRSRSTEYKVDNANENLILKTCPICQDTGDHFYLGIATKNLGLWNCFKCRQGGSWNKLKRHIVGEEGCFIDTPFHAKPKINVEQGASKTVTAHNRLLSDSDTMSWLYNRNIKIDSIQKYKLGVKTIEHPKSKEIIKYLTIPFIFKEQLVDIKYRSLPPAKKSFYRTPGGMSILYNYDNIDHSLNYIYICEGELDAISLAQEGESNIVSITVGAKSFIPEWFDLLREFKIIYLVMDNDAAGQEGAKIIANRLGRDRCYNILLPKEVDPKTKKPKIKDLNDYFRYHDISDFKTLTLRATQFTIDTIYSIENVISNLESQFKDKGELIEGLATPWESLNSKMGPIARGDLIYLSGKPKTGKCVEKSTKICTHKGLISIEEMFSYYGISLDNDERVEDISSKKIFVDTSNGRRQITHFTINGRRELLEIRTKLGLSIKVTKNHPLRVMGMTGKLKWVAAKDLRVKDRLVVSRSISEGGAVDLITREEARFIGYLIADGCLSVSNRILFSNSNQDVINDYKSCVYTIDQELEVEHYPQKNSNGVEQHINSKRFREFIRSAYTLDYVKAADKVVPLLIRTSSNIIWKEFLSAYFECKSYINISRNCIEVTSSSKELIDTIQLMLLSLGIVSRQRMKKVKGYDQPYYELVLPFDEAIKFIQRIGYISKEQKDKIDILLRNSKIKRNKSNDTVPFQREHFLYIQDNYSTDGEWNHLANKIVRGVRDPSHALLERIINYIDRREWDIPICTYWKSIRNMYFDSITSIENIGEKETYDIVQPETNEFIGNGIINHNTTLALNLCYYFSYIKKIPSLLFCLEMPPERLTAKLICRHRLAAHKEIALDDIYLTRADFLDPNNGDVQLYFGYTADPHYLNIDAMFKVFEVATRKYGIEFLVFDNLQFLSRNLEHTAQEIAMISRQFKIMAMNFNIRIMVVVQPKRISEDEIMTSVHMKDSSAMEADADCVLICHRKSFAKDIYTEKADDETLLSPIITLTVDRTRYAQGGFTRMFLEGAKSYIREATDNELVLNGSR